MALTNVWLAGYGGPAIGATAVWIAPNDGTVPSATQVTLVGWNGPVSGATPIWIAGYGGPPPAAIGAIPICISGWSGSGGGGGGATSVWSAADATANGMTLSNGGLTVTTTTAVWQTARGTISKTSGKLYVEFLMVAPGLNDVELGLASASFNPTNALGTSTYSAGVWLNNNRVSAGFTSNYTIAQFPVTNDVWALAVDFTAGSIWIAKNNVWFNSSNPATGSLPIISFVPATVGALFPGVSPEDASQTWTLQSTAASQKYAPPSGFSAWDGGVAPPPTSVWSSSDAAANAMTLSNGGLTVTSPGGSKSIRSTIGKSSGNLYVEFLAVHTQGNEYQGVADSSFSPAGLVGSSGQSGGATWNANLVSGSFIANFNAGAIYPNTGDVVGIAVDFTLGQVWISIRGVWLGGGTPTFTKSLPMFSFVPATAGALFPCLSPTDAGDVWTLQPTAASQTYAPPAGFTAWG